MKYGIRILTTEWACDTNFKNHVGTKEEMTAIINTYKNERIPPNIRYTVILYNGENSTPPTFPSQPENPRNSRMKR